ncbi:MAG: F0F1 ATP synthase subunit A [Chryseolinea sp.]
MSVFFGPAKRLISLLVLFVFFSNLVFSQHIDEHETTGHQVEAEAFNPNDVIIEHVLDNHVWHLWDHGGTIFLPVIVYSGERGVEMFSSRNFYDEHHTIVEYNGYKLEEGHIFLGEHEVLDLSITKNVAMLLINAVVLLLVFTSVARGFQHNRGKSPKGIQSFFEPIIVFVRDEVVKPNIGPQYEKFLPYMLSLFFFILFGNMIGLLPGAGNMTGNIAVTLTLAAFTFVITNVKGNKGYWSHIFWTPGVPLPMRILILPVEIIGIFTKPLSLTFRLFVAITAGHIVLLALISLAFILQSVAVGFVSSLILVFISLIEILVAGIQAYVFTLFSSLYIGMAIAEHVHDDHH